MNQVAKKLAEKKYLRHLIFQWFLNLYDRGENDENDNIQVLKGLQPPKDVR